MVSAGFVIEEMRGKEEGGMEDNSQVLALSGDVAGGATLMGRLCVEQGSDRAPCRVLETLICWEMTRCRCPAEFQAGDPRQEYPSEPK